MLDPGERWLSPEARGLSPEARGLNPEARGLNPEERGLNPEERGLNPEERGLNPEERGLNPEERGLDPEERGLASMVTEMDRRLEISQCDMWWLPKDVHVVHRPEITYVHSTARPQHLYNRVARIYAPARDYPRLLAEVMAAHGEGVSEFHLGAPSLNDLLEAELASAGYTVGLECIAYSCPVDAPRPPSVEGIEVRMVETRAQIKDQIKAFRNAFGISTEPPTEAEVDFQLSTCTGPGTRSRRFVAYDQKTEQPLAFGALNIFRALGLGFLWGGGTVPEARGRGVYSALTSARMAFAQSVGLTHVGLYAVVDTSAPIVAAQGFEAHGPCRFWGRKPSAQ